MTRVFQGHGEVSATKNKGEHQRLRHVSQSAKDKMRNLARRDSRSRSRNAEANNTPPPIAGAAVGVSPPSVEQPRIQSQLQTKQLAGNMIKEEGEDVEN